MMVNYYIIFFNEARKISVTQVHSNCCKLIIAFLALLLFCWSKLHISHKIGYMHVGLTTMRGIWLQSIIIIQSKI